MVQAAEDIRQVTTEQRKSCAAGRASNIQHSTSNLGRGRPVFAALRRGRGRVEMRAGFASIAPEILFKLDACRDRRHARW